MREIKFKVWDEINNKMYDYGSDEACELLEDGVDFMGMSFLSCQPNVIWLQYTGEKDIHGKEIYDGDIINRANSYDKKLSENYTITWSEKYLSWYAEGFGTLCDVGSDIKVIGSIYENSELLETR